MEIYPLEKKRKTMEIWYYTIIKKWNLKNTGKCKTKCSKTCFEQPLNFTTKNGRKRVAIQNKVDHFWSLLPRIARNAIQ